MPPKEKRPPYLTVGQLRAELEKYPPDMPVWIYETGSVYEVLVHRVKDETYKGRRKIIIVAQGTVLPT